MKSVGFDTCVVLRLLVGEPSGQAKQAFAYLEKCYLTGIAVYVSDLVVVEVYLSQGLKLLIYQSVALSNPSRTEN